MENFYLFKRKQKPERQEVVRQQLVKADFRMEPDKKELLEEYCEHNKQTFSELMRELTDQAVVIIKQAEIEGI